MDVRTSFISASIALESKQRSWSGRVKEGWVGCGGVGWGGVDEVV